MNAVPPPNWDGETPHRRRDERDRRQSRSRARAFALCVISLWALVLALHHVIRLPAGLPAAIAMVCLAWSFARLILSTTNDPMTVRAAEWGVVVDAHVAIVVPVHNEDPAYFQLCLDSISAQTRPVDAVWLVDDASTDRTCFDIASAWARRPHPFEVHVHRFEQNVGKRHAQSLAFREQPTDFWVTVDSDTVLDPRSVEEGLKPFTRADVQAVAGLSLGFNWRRNLLTRILDIEFVNSFLLGRAWQSRLGSVLVVCGTLAFYRSEVVTENLDAYLGETFLGHPVRAGDDRFLTQCALIRGRVVFQESSTSYTALPERLGHLVRQRLRWSASFYRGAWWTAHNMPLSRAAYWLIVGQVIELFFVAFMFGALVLHAPRVGLVGLGLYAFYLTALSYLRCVRYITFSRPDMTSWDKAKTVLVAPLIGALYLTVLTPLRYYALFRATDSSWRTRGTVEVSVGATGISGFKGEAASLES